MLNFHFLRDKRCLEPMLIFSTTEYLKRVPVSIDTSITDLTVNSLNISDFEHPSQSWKAVCCTTQTRRQVQSQQLQKGIVKTTKSTFSTTGVNGFTKLKGNLMRLNLIAKLMTDNQLSLFIQCTPIYCKLEPGSNSVSAGLRNISAKKITIPAKAVICQVQLANMEPMHQ